MEGDTVSGRGSNKGKILQQGNIRRKKKIRKRGKGSRSRREIRIDRRRNI